MHHQSGAINEQLAELEQTYLKTGDVTADPESGTEIGSNPMERSMENERTEPWIDRRPILNQASPSGQQPSRDR